MTYKISYPKDYANDGTSYDQRVTVKCSTNLVKKLNKKVSAIHEAIDRKIVVPYDEDYVRTFLRHVSKGKNYTTLTTARYLSKWLGFDHDKRFKTDRNTVVIFA